MRAILLLALLAPLLSGCLTSQQAVPRILASTLRTLVVVPVESPPLLVHPESEADRAAMRAVGLSAPAHGVAFVPLRTPIPALNAVNAVVGGVSQITSQTASLAPGGKGSLILAKAPAPPWMMTEDLAATAARLLQSSANRSVSVIEGYAQLQISDRSLNYIMENWYAPVRRWYNSDVSELDYSQPPTTQADAVLEIGMLNYEYALNHLLVTVMVKVVDPKTGKIIARANKHSNRGGGSLAEMLQNQGQPLRDLVVSDTEALLGKCLQDVGLMPR